MNKFHYELRIVARTLDYKSNSNLIARKSKRVVESDDLGFRSERRYHACKLNFDLPLHVQTHISLLVFSVPSI